MDKRPITVRDGRPPRAPGALRTPQSVQTVLTHTRAAPVRNAWPKPAVPATPCRTCYETALTDATILNVALSTISRDLSGPLNRVDGLVVGFLASLAAFIPASGWSEHDGLDPLLAQEVEAILPHTGDHAPPVGFHNSATSLYLGLLCGPLILVDEAAEDRAAFDPLPVVVGRVLVQDCPQMRAGRRTARFERRQVLGDLMSEYRRAA